MKKAIELIEKIAEKKGIMAATDANQLFADPFLVADAFNPVKFLQTASTRSTIEKLKEGLVAFHKVFH